jgi:hypothetical protein
MVMLLMMVLEIPFYVGASRTPVRELRGTRDVA